MGKPSERLPFPDKYSSENLWSSSFESEMVYIMLNVKCNSDYNVQNTSHCACTVQMRGESESGIRK